MKNRFLGAAVLSGVLILGTGVALSQDNSYPQTPVQTQQNYPNQQQNYPNQNYPNQQQPYPNQYPNQQTGAYGQNGPYYGVTLPAGTEISVRTNQNINSKQNQPGQVFDAEIENNVLGPNGNIIIPKGAQAQLALVDSGHNGILGKNELGLALQSVNVNGQQMMLQTNSVNGGGNNGGIGANKRTGEYVGGGALIGTILGAVVGGGKGAAIGAVLGGAGGAGTQVLTRGSQVNVPAETILNFKLDQPVTLQ